MTNNINALLFLLRLPQPNCGQLSIYLSKRPVKTYNNVKWLSK